MLIDALESCEILVDYYVFVSLIHWWASDAMLNFSKRNNLIYILDGLRVSTFSENFHFWVNYFFNFLF